MCEMNFQHGEKELGGFAGGASRRVVAAGDAGGKAYNSKVQR
jgi:hypothetical protein